MTSLPAQRMRLWDRGVVRPGAVRRPRRLRSRDHPRSRHLRAAAPYAEGIRYVAVNGQLVVDGGQMTAARPGRALRGPGRK